MNERIRQLAEQARDYVADAIELGFPQDQIDDIRDEKFAELIVRECADIAREIGNNAEPDDFALECYEIEDQIMKHFGVEE
jgi:hypothetical protein